MRRIYEILGNTLHWAFSYYDEVSALLESNACEEARACIQKALQYPELEGFEGIFYENLCRTWIHDRAAEGLDWAAGALEGTEAFYVRYPTDGGHLRKLLRTLGTIERIFREFGRQEEFRRRVDRLRDALRAAGYRTDVIWYLDKPIALPEVESAGSPESWNWTREDEQSEMTWQDGALIFRIFPDQISGLVIPRFTRQITGDFSLQVTIHSGARLLDDVLQYRRRTGAGQTVSAVSVGGGLCVFRDSKNTSARISTSASRAWNSTCRRCVSVGTTSPTWSPTPSLPGRSAKTSPDRPSLVKPWRSC